MKNQEKFHKKANSQIKKAGFFILSFNFLILNSFRILPVTAATEEPVLSVVHSQENANQWAGISDRLQAIGAKYCVITLNDVKSVADWGDRRVLFLPNVETLTPTQAIALEEWMSKGGRLIASGPVGSLSSPGVRQLLRSLLGGYWAFSLSETEQIKPTKTKISEWANQTELFGKVRGGVVIPNEMGAESPAVWNSKDNPAAVVTTERSTFLGWRWGTDTATASGLDNAWLKAAINYYLTAPAPSNRMKKVAGGSPNCSTTVAATPRKQGAGEQRGSFSPSSPPKTATAPIAKPLPTAKPPSSQEAIDQLEQAVGLDVAPNSNEPIDNNQA
ncbi:MAG: glycoside hydrolase family 10 protein, partial [Nostoc sp. C3-bin3]|nr:glycoside hydrolase family 10 protein [Nostoc sp. C3-bin3]